MKIKFFAGMCAAVLAVSGMSFLTFAASSNLKSFEATSANVKQIGRTYYYKDALWMDFSACGVEYTCKTSQTVINFKGDYMATDDSGARVAVYVDGVRRVNTLINKSTKAVPIALDSTKTSTIRVVKLSEAPNSPVAVDSIEVNGNEGIAPTAAKTHSIEFIGDSITCGYGVEDALGTASFSTANENAAKSYAYKTAQSFDADYSFVSLSGYGIVSGYSGPKKQNTAQTIPQYYDKLGYTWGRFYDAEVQKIDWDFSKFSPDVIVINLGTNDSSWTKGDADKCKVYEDGYVDFIKQIRAKNPNSKILCTLGIMGQDLYPQVENAVKTYKSQTSDENVYSFEFSQQDGNANGYAVDYHPTEQSHCDAAKELTAEMAKLFGWEQTSEVALEGSTDELIKGEVSIHKFGEWTITKKPTCTEKGSRERVCSVCGEKEVEEISATGHKFGSWTVTKKATYTSAGVMTRTCSVCGKKETKAIPKLARTSLSKATAKLSTTVYSYTGKAFKPSVTVKYAGKTLKLNTDYTVSYKNNKSVGKATVTVTGKNKYSGTKTLTFTIKPKKQTVTLKSYNDAFKATFKKDSQATGYQLQYSLKSNMKSAKSVIVSKKSTSKTVTKLKNKKAYYVRVRTYKTVSGSKIYGAWSTVKKVTTK